MFLFFLLTMDRRERLSRVLAAVVLSACWRQGTFWALFLLLLRYTHGSSVLLFNLSQTPGGRPVPHRPEHSLGDWHGFRCAIGPRSLNA